jgi:hypothetical protein
LTVAEQAERFRVEHTTGVVQLTAFTTAETMLDVCSSWLSALRVILTAAEEEEEEEDDRLNPPPTRPSTLSKAPPFPRAEATDTMQEAVVLAS